MKTVEGVTRIPEIIACSMDSGSFGSWRRDGISSRISLGFRGGTSEILIPNEESTLQFILTTLYPTRISAGHGECRD